MQGLKGLGLAVDVSNQIDTFAGIAPLIVIPGNQFHEGVRQGDSSAGIKAAHAAGMRAIWVPDLIQPTPDLTPLAFRVVADLYGVAALLTGT